MTERSIVQGFAQVLMKIAELWRTKRKELIEAGNHVIELIRCEFSNNSQCQFIYRFCDR
jgi:uncharacterized protein YyaL (SSP411 family)